MRAALLLTVGAIALVTLAGCGPVRLVASTNIPTPLVMKMPIAVALFVPQEFSQYVHNEERASTQWHVDLGRAQTEGITRLMSSLFERVVTVDSLAAGTQLGSEIRAILEPSIEEYAFVTPRDAGSPFFAVSIKYRVNVYMPDGKLADSWGFTGYGTSPSQGLSSAPPLQAATALAMRDAGAKLAVEFREQAVIRGLLPEPPSADSTPAIAAPGASEEPSETEEQAPQTAPENAEKPPQPAAPEAEENAEGEEPPQEAAPQPSEPVLPPPEPQPQAFAEPT